MVTTLHLKAIFLQMFIEGLKTNEDRYGYPSCPCRLATGNLEIDRDIICPCDYRDPDVAQYGACYCRLYVNKAVFESQNLPEVPERRPIEKQGRAYGIPGLSQQTPRTGNPRKNRHTTAKDRGKKEVMVLQTMRLRRLPRGPPIRLPYM